MLAKDAHWVVIRGEKIDIWEQHRLTTHWPHKTRHYYSKSAHTAAKPWKGINQVDFIK